MKFVAKILFSALTATRAAAVVFVPINYSGRTKSARMKHNRVREMAADTPFADFTTLIQTFVFAQHMSGIFFSGDIYYFRENALKFIEFLTCVFLDVELDQLSV